MMIVIQEMKVAAIRSAAVVKHNNKMVLISSDKEIYRRQKDKKFKDGTQASGASIQKSYGTNIA